MFTKKILTEEGYTKTKIGVPLQKCEEVTDKEKVIKLFTWTINRKTLPLRDLIYTLLRFEIFLLGNTRHGSNVRVKINIFYSGVRDFTQLRNTFQTPVTRIKF